MIEIHWVIIAMLASAWAGRQHLCMVLDKEISQRWKQVNKETIENITGQNR
jgi:hypothetical protein